MNDDSGCMAVIGFVFITCIATGWITSALVTDFHQDEAVKHGHARYYLDENNARQWEWLPPCGNVQVEMGEE